MFGLTKRLEQVRQATNPKEHCEDEHVRAGRDAEKSFITSLRTQAGFDETSFFGGLRIPDEYQSRRREIDIVLVDGTGIYCVEIKNWSGKIHCSDNNELWLQTKQHRIGDDLYTGREIEHENGLDSIKNKAVLLRAYLAKNDVFISESFFHPRILFVNKNCQVDPKIYADPHVLLAEDVDSFVCSFKKTFLTKLSTTMTPGWLSGQLSFSTLSLIRSALNTVGTWDIIHLNGGKRLYGDYRDCTYFSVNRSETETLEFTHQRNGIMGSLLAIAGQVPSTTVYFLQRGGTGWLWNSYSAVVKIPYNTEVNFRVCGDENDAKIPANDILRIEISR